MELFLKDHVSIIFSAFVAAKEVNTSKCNILGVSRAKTKTSGGFIWKY